MELEKSHRRAALIRTALTIVLAWVLIVGRVLPAPDRPGVRIAGGPAPRRRYPLVGGVFAWQIRRIAVAELPELRAIEALGIVVAVFLIAFSAIYLAMSHQAAGNFTQTLDHTEALYLTITVFSTVGFGDITPKTDAARLIVSSQMLLDLVVIGAVVRLLFNTAKNRISPNPTPASTSDS